MSKDDIKAPKESFFVSESIADSIDMTQFESASEQVVDPILDASMHANIVAGSEVTTVALALCKFGGESCLEIVGIVDATFDPTYILNSHVDRVEINFPNGTIQIVDTSELTPCVCIQPNDTNFVLTINFK